ncbi:MAG TPA: hypothetical protein VME17_19345 [Bryobacteraceae bacterium]|nr:hypothetical protein [Bryobacteraceae bacterium]
MNGNLVQAVRGPIMLITLGALVAIDYAGIYGFWRTWPVLIIVFGVLKLMERSSVRPPQPYPGNQPPGSATGGGNVSGRGNVI